jgi:hypothetical protein
MIALEDNRNNREDARSRRVENIERVLQGDSSNETVAETVSAKRKEIRACLVVRMELHSLMDTARDALIKEIQRARSACAPC